MPQSRTKLLLFKKYRNVLDRFIHETELYPKTLFRLLRFCFEDNGGQ